MGDDPPASLAPNYDPSVTPTHVFTTAVQHILSETKIEHRLSVLAKAGTGYPGGMDGLPSWVPDWTQSPPGAPLSSFLYQYQPFRYKASGKARPEIHDIDPNAGTLSLGCIHADEITFLSEPYVAIEDDKLVADRYGQIFHPGELVAHHKWHTDTFAMAASVLRDPYPFKQGQSVKEAFWRALLGDVHKDSRPAAGYLGELYDDWVAMQKELLPYGRDAGHTLSFPQDDAFWDRMRRTGQWNNAMATCAVGRRLCVTREGYLGCVPRWATVGDEIIVILGASTPFVVRGLERQGGERYELVGECYVHGMMDGEILESGRKQTVLLFQ